MSPIAAEREYFYDLMSKAFIASFALTEKYAPNKECEPFIAPVLRTVALPAPQRAGARAAHMNQWESIAQPFGLKANLNTASGHDSLFPDFAFEVALAVCAYDIDDSSFCQHRYYPRDMVEHYRANVRHRRDAWRAPGAGAAVTVDAPAPAAKADLSQSTRGGIARWLELVSDGDDEVLEQVQDAVGKSEPIEDVDSFLCALAETGHGIHADLKDHDTLESQAAALALARELGEFAPPAGPPLWPGALRGDPARFR